MDRRGSDVAELAVALRGRLVERRRADAASRSHDEDIAESARAVVEERAAVLAAANREQVVERIVRDSVGLGPLEVLLADPAVEEVLVNAHD
jgi:pilus assembly protein CpaF